MTPRDDVPHAPDEASANAFDPAPISAATIVEALGSMDRSVQRRASDQLVALGEWSSGVRAAVTAAMTSASSRCRWAALFTIARHDGLTPSHFDVLVPALDSSDPDIRWACRTILVDHCPVEVFRELVAHVGRHGSPVQRRMVLYSVNRSSGADEAVARFVLDQLEFHDPLVRLAAVSALTRAAVAPETQLNRLVARFQDGDPGVRRAAVVALAKVGRGSPAGEAALKALTLGDAEDLRVLAARVLRT